MRSATTAMALALCFALPLGPGSPRAFAQTLSQPEPVGDQAVFFFDARSSFTTFLSLRNTAAIPLNVRILFYTGDFFAPLARDFSLAPQSLRVVDVGALRDGGLPSEPGVAIATAIDDQGRPVVSRALSGNFTVANVATGSAWGAAAAARAAQNAGSGTPPANGSTINGTSVLLPAIAPQAADLAAFYDPNDLAPASSGGNELVFVAFEDVPGTTYAAMRATVSWGVDARRNDGTPIAATTFAASGVVVSDLATVAGAGVNGATGWIRFTAPGGSSPPTRLIFFAEALGTFGTGYLLPNSALALCCPAS